MTQFLLASILRVFPLSRNGRRISATNMTDTRPSATGSPGPSNTSNLQDLVDPEEVPVRLGGVLGGERGRVLGRAG